MFGNGFVYYIHVFIVSTRNTRKIIIISVEESAKVQFGRSIAGRCGIASKLSGCCGEKISYILVLGSGNQREIH